MELKEMIAELIELEPGVELGFAEYEKQQRILAAAAEALELVAWAEEHGGMVQRVRDRWMCSLETKEGISHYGSPTLLGAIRAAKEAYEAE